MSHGVYRAIVQDVRDPASSGRIKVSIPAISGDSPSDWIYPVINGGYVVTPKPGDQVWVMFEAGDEDNPVWIGATKTSTRYKDLVTQVETLQTQMANVLSRLAAHSI